MLALDLELDETNEEEQIKKFAISRFLLHIRDKCFETSPGVKS